MERLIDLHIHTTASDGEYTPKEIIKLAEENNVGIISITDHDTLKGAIEAIQYYNKIEKNVDDGLIVIPGIELSAKSDSGKMHILGYDIDLNYKPILKELVTFQLGRIERAINILVYLKKNFNLTFSEEDRANLLCLPSMGRPHIAQLCLKYNYVSTLEEAYQKYLNEASHQCFKYKLSPEQCINLISKANALPVLAHPLSLKQDYEELKRTIEELDYYGLRGIEVFHPDHSKDDIEKLLMLADKYNLYYSGGSDFHGPSIKPHNKLGTIRNGKLKVKQLTILDRINRKRS